MQTLVQQKNNTEAKHSRYDCCEVVSNTQRSHVWLCFLIVVVLFLFVGVIPQGYAETTEVEQDVAELEREKVLQEYAYRIWSEINEIRCSPREALSKYGFDLEYAAAVLDGGAEMLDSGLPPLAWNQLLTRSSALHARDMTERFYYSEVNPDGEDVYIRAENAGYAPAHAVEGLGLLAFPAFIDIDEAVDILMQNLIYDDLYIRQSSSRIVFTSQGTEMGLTLSVESFPHIAGNEHVYLLVLDVAAPQVLRVWAVGSVGEGISVAYKDRYTGFMDYVPTLPGGAFQTELGVSGGTVYAFSSSGAMQDCQTVYSRTNVRIGFDVPEDW